MKSAGDMRRAIRGTMRQYYGGLEEFRRANRIAELESAVVSAAIRFREAETAVWVESEVGTDESEAKAKAERPRAYLEFVVAVDNLVVARKRAETKGNSQDDLDSEERERGTRKDVLRWVQEEIIPEIGDMGGDAARRKWWNEAGNVLHRLLNLAIAHPEMTTSEELYAAQPDETPTGDINTVQEDVL